MMNERKNEVKFSINLNEEQKEAKSQILNHPFNFIEGNPGCGKTLLAAQTSLDLFFKGKVEKIVITRPTVSTEDNGFLPGDIDEKMDPWLVPIRDNLRKVYNKPDKLKSMEQKGEIELVPLSYFRGRTFENAVCIIDEFQNLTRAQLSMCIGRLGKNSLMIFCGDQQQIDLKRKTDSAYFEIEKIQTSKYVFRSTLSINHRHEAVNEILELLK